MNLFQNFKPTSQATQAAATNSATPSADQNATVPNNTNTLAQPVMGDDGKPVPAASPLDKFKDLWQIDTNTQADTPFSFNSDPAKLLEAAKGVNFTEILTPELQAKINQGGAEGQRAVMEAMNNVAQLTFAQASHASAKMAETAVLKMQEKMMASLPQLIKQHQVQDTLRTTNPLMSDPAMAPMIQALQHQFTQKFPTATAAQIEAHVNDYLNGAADRIQGLRPVPVDKNKKPEMDWSTYI